MMIRVPLLPEKRVYEYINPGLLCVRVHAEKRDARYSLMTIALPTCKISPTRPLCSRFFCQKEAFSREKKEREDTQHKHEKREAKKLCSPGPPPFFFSFSLACIKKHASLVKTLKCVWWCLVFSDVFSEAFFFAKKKKTKKTKKKEEEGDTTRFVW